MGDTAGPRRPAAAWAIVALCIAAVVPVTAQGQDDGAPTARIEIFRDSDFTAANGVVGGAGTPENPYRIDGWVLEHPQASVFLSNTRAHVVLSNLTVRSAGSQPGVELRFARNVVVEDVRVNMTALAPDHGATSVGIDVFYASNVALRNNHVTGAGPAVRIVRPSGITVNGNTLAGGPIELAGGFTIGPGNDMDVGPHNTVNGGPLVVLANCLGTALHGQVVGQLLASNCTGLEVRDIVGADALPYMTLSGVENVTLQNVSATHVVFDGTNGTFRDLHVVGEGGLQVSGSNITVANSTIAGGAGLHLHRAEGVLLEGVRVVDPWFSGLTAVSVDGLVVRGGSFDGGEYGSLNVWGGEDITIEGNLVESRGYYGIYVEEAVNLTIEGNSVNSTVTGIHLDFVMGATLSSNVVLDGPAVGVVAERVERLVMRDNQLGPRGIVFGGYVIEHFAGHSIDSSNMIDSGPVRYIADCAGTEIGPAPAGQVVVANCTDVRVHGLDLRGAAVPLQGAFLVNTSVSGVALNGNMTGMRAFGTEGLEVRDSSIRGGLGCLEVEYSFWVRVVNNTFDGCDRGVSMTDTWESQVAGNRVGAEAVSGISLSNSGHVRVASNTMMRGGLAIEGQAKGFYTTIDVAPDNTVGGLPLAFHRNETGLRVAGATVGQFIAVNCTGLQAEGVSAVGGTPGGLVAYSDGARLTGSRFVNSTSEGLRVVYSEGVVLEDVAASGNGRAGDPPYSFGIGLHVLRSSVAVEGGEFSDNTGAGIRADDSADLGINGSLVARNGGYGVEVNGVSGAASLEGVVVRENTFGIRLNVGSGAVARVGNSTVSANAEGGADARGDGELVVRDSAFTGNGGPGLASRVGRILIEGNRFVGNEVGLAVTWHSTRYEGNVSNNVFDENALGARIVQSALVRVFHNQFLRNEVQALTDAGTTRWDAGYPAGGNFWSDYNGTDRCTSDTQDICPIPDGLGDAPREVPLDPDYAPGLPVRDRYPLMEPAVRSSAQPPSEATPRDVPELLEFLTTLPGALLVLLALPAAGAAVVWVRQRRRGPA